LVANHPAHLLRHLGRGVGDGKVLTDDAAKLRRDGSGLFLQVGRRGREDRFPEDKQPRDN